MSKKLKYAFFTGTIAYAIAALLLFIFFAAQTGWGRSVNDIGLSLVSGLTLSLSEFGWWGDYYYLAFLVPWLGSTLVMALLLLWLKDRAVRRYLAGGLSVFIYYIAMFLAFTIHGLARGWGDVGYAFLPVWAVVGFGVGYASAAIVEKILKPQTAD
jgi:hypothetical protein